MHAFITYYHNSQPKKIRMSSGLLCNPRISVRGPAFILIPAKGEGVSLEVESYVYYFVLEQAQPSLELCGFLNIVTSAIV